MARRLQANPLDAMLQTQQPEAPVFDVDRERAALGIQVPEKRGKGKPRNDDLIRGGVQDGLTEDWTRASFIMKVETLDKLKDYAYTQRLKIKDALDEILTDFLNKQDDLLPHK